eukprot:2939196-Pyramimonas_sp.AAC.1
MVMCPQLVAERAAVGAGPTPWYRLKHASASRTRGRRRDSTNTPRYIYVTAREGERARKAPLRYVYVTAREGERTRKAPPRY